MQLNMMAFFNLRLFLVHWTTTTTKNQNNTIVESFSQRSETNQNDKAPINYSYFDKINSNRQMTRCSQNLYVDKNGTGNK